MVDYTALYDTLKGASKTASLGEDIIRNKKAIAPALNAIEGINELQKTKPVKGTQKNTGSSVLENNIKEVSQKLGINRGFQASLAGLSGVVEQKGKDFLDSVGEVQKSFYQGKIPNETLAKIASPSIGASSGVALGAMLPIPHPLLKGAAIAGSGLIGGGLGYLGSGQLTPDEKKAAQIRSKEAGFEKQFSNPQQWGYNAATNLKAIPQIITDIGTGIQSIPGAIGGGAGKAMKESNIPGIKQYGMVLEKIGNGISKLTKEERKFATDKINYASNLPFKPKDEEDGYKRVSELPYEVIQHMSPEALKAMIKGENFDKVSIPEAVSEAYNKSQNLAAQNKMVSEFRNAGKSDEEINKLVNFGMAGAPLEGIAQSFTSDPTMLIDPALMGMKGIKGAAKVGEGIQRAGKLKALNAERGAVQAARAATPIVDAETGQAALKGLLPKGELPKPSIPNLETTPGKPIQIDNPNQLNLDFNAPPKQEILPATPVNPEIKNFENLPKSPEVLAPKGSNQLANDLAQEEAALTSQGIDFENDIDGYEKLIDNLKAKGHDEIDIISHLNGESPKGDLPIPTENIPAKQTNPWNTPEYDNPDENHLYDLIKGDTTDASLKHQFTNQGGLPLGFYEGEKRIPIYSDVENNVLKRLPVNFEFQHPLEKELFGLGSDYVDWARDPKKIEEIKNAQNLQRDKTAKAVYLDKNIGDKYNEIGSNLLLGTKDPKFLDSLGLPEKGQKEVKELLKTFVQKIYSGGKNARGGKLGEGVLGHVPNAIRKDLLQQIGTKLGLEGKTAAEKKAILEGLNSLGDEPFKLKGDAYKGLISHTKEFRNKFKIILNKYKNEMI